MKPTIALAALLLVIPIHAQVFPGRAATDADLGVAANRVTTSLTGAIGTGDTSITVATSTRIVPNLILTLSTKQNTNVEYVWVCSVSGNTLQLGRSSCPNIDGRGVDGTSALAHSSGEIVAGNINALYQQSLANEIKAIEQTSATFAPASFYNFTPQQPGGSLISGNNAITMRPVPAGVNGSDAGHRLYVSGGSGTAEACLITGGSGTAGQASGQIIINCANTHSGAFTVASANGGISEAQQAAATAGNGAAVIQLPPGGIVMHAGVVGISGLDVFFEGVGSQSGTISRASDFTSGAMFTSSAFNHWYFHNIFFSQALGGAAGSTIDKINGFLEVQNVYMFDGLYGIRFSNSSGVINNFGWAELHYTYTPDSAIWVGNIGGAGIGGNIMITNSELAGAADQTISTDVGCGLRLRGVDSILVTGSLINGAQTGVCIENTSGTAGDYNVNINLTGNILIDNIVNAVSMYGNSTTCTAINLGNNWLQGDNGGSSSSGAGRGEGISFGTTGQPTSCDHVTITGGGIEGFYEAGFHGWTGSKTDITISGVSIHDNNRGNLSGIAAVYLENGATGYTLNINTYNESAGHQKYGLHAVGSFSGTVTGTITGDTAPVLFGGSVAGIIGPINGITNVIGSVSDAATIVWPLNPNFIITGSGTGVTAVTMTSIAPGATGTLRTTGGAITFTAGGGIGNTFTTVQNVPVVWTWDGTSLWLK